MKGIRVKTFTKINQIRKQRYKKLISVMKCGSGGNGPRVAGDGGGGELTRRPMKTNGPALRGAPYLFSFIATKSLRFL